MQDILQIVKDFALSDRGLAFAKSAILLIVGTFVARGLGAATAKVLAQRTGPQAVILLRRLVTYGVLLVFAIAALREAGFDLSVLLGAAGVLTVALGFASQTSVSNLISGLFLIGERAFEIGENIKIGEVTGEVLSIDWMSVKLRTFDNLLVRLPNETVLKSQITNLSRFPIRRVDQLFRVPYGTDVDTVRQLLLKAAQDIHICLDEPKPTLFHKGFGEFGIDLQFSGWALSQNFLELRNQLPEAISEILAEAHIDIPIAHRGVVISQAAVEDQRHSDRPSATNKSLSEPDT